jgi:glucose/arabinose dehydrogenase
MHARLIGAAILAALSCTSAAVAAGGPPPPKAANGHKVTVVGVGVPTPTAFAFLGGQTFVAGFGDEEHPKVKGGIYVLKGGKAVRVPGSPPHVFGLAAAGSTLYVSDAAQILAWSGWNGTRFARSKVVASGPKGTSGFNGIAVKGGTIYSGISLGDGKKDDFSKGKGQFANSVVKIDIASGKVSSVSTGYRQPWQLIFIPGHSGPIVSDLGQENLGKRLPPDYLQEARQGTDYGFPACPAKPSTCSKYAKPFASFPAHASPMGLGFAGGKLYVALFGGTATSKGPEVVSLPATGGSKTTPVLTGFKAPVVALATHGALLYAGDLTGSIYTVAP